MGENEKKAEGAPADTSADLAPGTEVGGYVIEAKVGEGGMGQVYAARHPRIGKKVAIKVLARAFTGDQNVVDRFEQEARLVNEIHHPNIVDVFQFDKLPDNRTYFVMELLDGEPLTARIERGPIPAKEATEILDVICDALEAAHEKGVIHRDLKSDNVFLVASRGKRTVKLLDFGLAKLSGRGMEGAPVGRTKSGILVGTPAYMSPEQARGKEVDPRTDIYALGVLAYKMLTGVLPFRGENAMDIILQQLNTPAPHPIKLAPKTPQPLSRIVVKMMSKSPDERPTLAAIRKLFTDMREGGIPTTPTPEPRPSRGQVPRRDSQPMERPPETASGGGIGVKAFLIVLMLLFAGAIAVVVMLMMDKKPTPSAAGSAGSGSSELVAEGSGSATGSATATGSGSAQQPVIEFEPDPVGSGASASGTGSGSSSTSKRRRDRQKEDDEATEALANANNGSDDLPVAKKPGAIFLMLERPATIEIDGKVVATNAKGGRFEVSPGHHEIKVKAADRSPVSRSVDVEPGGSAVIRIADDQGGESGGGTGSGESTE